MTSESTISVTDASIKKRVRGLARFVMFEFERFIEDSTKMQGEQPERPRVPIFFTRAFNELKSHLIDNNQKDIFLDTMQHMARCSLLSEFGPAKDGNDFPEYLENGLLEIKDQPMESEVDSFINDIVNFVCNAFDITGELLLLPLSYHITLEDYKKKDLGCLVDRIPVNIHSQIQNYVGGAIDDYMEKCNNQYRAIVDSFKSQSS